MKLLLLLPIIVEAPGSREFRCEGLIRHCKSGHLTSDNTGPIAQTDLMYHIYIINCQDWSATL